MGSNPEEGKIKGSIRDLSDYLVCFFLFILLNILVFHTGLYGHLTVVESYAGNVYGRLRALKKLEKDHGKRVVAIVGDSITEHGVGAKELSEFMGKPVANLALPGTGPMEWLHFLKSIDPKRNRFETLVIPIVPHNMRTRPHEDGVQTLLPAASLEQMLSYAWQFEESRKLEYLYATFDKMFAFRRDLRHLLLSPDRLLTIRKQKQNQLEELNNWPGETFDVCEVQVDPHSRVVTDWGKIADPEIQPLAQNAINRITQLNRRPVVSGILEPLEEITNYYHNSTTDVVVITMPFGVGHRLPRGKKQIQDYYNHIQKLDEYRHVWHWNAIHERVFQDCENYFDFRHLNAKGRKILTRRLAFELKKIQSEKSNLIDSKPVNN